MRRVGRREPGVPLVIPQNTPIREVVETIMLIRADDGVNDWENLIARIPF
jgi:hypothetical protein